VFTVYPELAADPRRLAEQFQLDAQQPHTRLAGAQIIPKPKVKQTSLYSGSLLTSPETMEKVVDRPTMWHSSN